MEKAELVITALQQRIGEIVANYELQLALVRAEYTELQDKQKAIDEYSKSVQEKANAAN